MTIALATNLMFITSLSILGGLAIWQAIKGCFVDFMVSIVLFQLVAWAW